MHNPCIHPILLPRKCTRAVNQRKAFINQSHTIVDWAIFVIHPLYRADLATKIGSKLSFKFSPSLCFWFNWAKIIFCHFHLCIILLLFFFLFKVKIDKINGVEWLETKLNNFIDLRSLTTLGPFCDHLMI